MPPYPVPAMLCYAMLCKDRVPCHAIHARKYARQCVQTTERCDREKKEEATQHSALERVSDAVKASSDISSERDEGYREEKKVEW